MTCSWSSSLGSVQPHVVSPVGGVERILVVHDDRGSEFLSPTRRIQNAHFVSRSGEAFGATGARTAKAEQSLMSANTLAMSYRARAT
jgi:hypothetical protein